MHRNTSCLLSWAALVAALLIPPTAHSQWRTELAEEVAAGDYHSCVVTSCGEVDCFGRNDWGQAVDKYDRDYVDVSVGQYHTCALDSGGGIRCWGRYTYGQVNPPAGVFVDLDAGANHNCAIRTDGTLACWGANFYGQSTPPPGSYRAVTAGSHHSCAITEDEQEVVCWGRNSHGQLAVENTSAMYGYVDAAILPEADEDWRDVFAGGYHTCAISTDEHVYCWGHDAYQAVTGAHPQFPNQPWGQEISPGIFQIPLRKMLTMDAGRFGNCSVYHDKNAPNHDNDEALCWGWPFTLSGYAPPQDPPESVAVGTSHACMVTIHGGLECWGSNGYGQTNAPVMGGYCPFRLYQPFPFPQPRPTFGGF